MSKSNVSDIDYSVFNTTSVEEKPSEVAKPKSVGISQRSLSKAKQEEKPRDLVGASNPVQIAERVTETSNALPNPEVPDAMANYALPALGALGAGLAAYGLWKNKDNLPLGQTIAGAPAEGMTQKTDLRNVAPTPEVAPAPVAQELPKPQFPQGNVQQPAVSGYGQQTINAPTGAPNVAASAAVAPPAKVAPQPVDPIQAAKIREAEAKAAIAEHKLQQLQAGPKTSPAAKVGKPPVSEADMQMIQKSGAASASKQLQAMDAASKIAPTPDPIQMTATPVEKQAAVAVVEKTKPEPVVKKAKAAVPPGMTKEEAGMMNHLLGMYGGKDDPFSMKAYEQVKEILGYTPAYQTGKGGSLSAEETGKVLGWRKENVPGPKVNLTHDMKKVLKAGGPAAIAAMVLTPEFAKASTSEKAQIIGESFLPIGITPTELAPGTLTEKQFKAYENSQKLGSPYRSVPPPR
jgi:hypothetical protein